MSADPDPSPRRSARLSLSSGRGIDLSSLRISRSHTPRTTARSTKKAKQDGKGEKADGKEREDDMEQYWKKKQEERKEQHTKKLLANPIQSLVECASAGPSRWEDFQFLLQQDLDLDEMYEDQSALMAACKWNNQPAMEALVRAGADVNLQNSAGLTALMYAVGTKQSNMPLVSFLLDHSGADPTLTTRSGYSAIQVAFESGHPLVASKLVKALARPTQPPITTTTKERRIEMKLRVEEAKKRREQQQNAGANDEERKEMAT